METLSHKILSSSEDKFNSFRTRNQKNTLDGDYNCGGYALGTFNWFLPYNNFNSNYSFALNLLEEYNDIDYVMEMLFEKNVENILNFLKDKIRRIYSLKELLQNEDLIAFRICIIYDSEFNELEDTDFHFRLYHNGKWTEKMGATTIVECSSYEEEIWNEGFGFEYLNPTALFALKI